jgi:hypothetical protein
MKQAGHLVGRSKVRPTSGADGLQEVLEPECAVPAESIRLVATNRHANDGSILMLNWLVLNVRFLMIQSPSSVARPLRLSVLSSRIQQVRPA